MSATHHSFSTTGRRHLRRRGARARARGSALLVSLVLVAGLSLLGLAFVGVSETETAIASNQRTALQTQAMAESGARAVMEWFQNPQWARDLAIMPTNNPAPTGMKRTRVVDAYTGVYKPLATQLLFDKPYRPLPQHRFFGDENTADITITHDIDATTLENLNNFLFGWNDRSKGRIEEIRIYAPPIVGGNLTGGFWVGGERFGTATIRVTAEKWNASETAVLSRKVVRLVVGEFPIPIPAGPIQTASNAAFGGSFDVRWGQEVALGDLDPSVVRTRLPWMNAFERPPFERGYDNEVFPLAAPNDIDYLRELVGKTFQDPWGGTRSRGDNSQCGACGAYTRTADETAAVHSAFEGQVSTIFPTMRAVTFPTIRYETWKRIAMQGRGTKGLYYFDYVEGTNPPVFQKNGQGDPKPIPYWVNTIGTGARLGAGLYFFDGVNGQDPQLIGGGTNVNALAEGVSWQSADVTQDFLMAGFVYLNIKQFRANGVGNSAPTRPYNMPGEVFRDVGHRVWAAGGWQQTVVTTPPTFDVAGAGDGEFSFQDLNNNGRFDVVVQTAAVASQSNDPGVVNQGNQFFVKTWSSTGWGGTACTVPPVSGVAPASACSEPHEPYLNFIYPTTAAGAVRVGWEANGADTRRPRDLDADGVTLPNCATAPQRCTSNGFDRDGALVNIAALLNGVLYIEGTYNTQGQVNYFGSVLVRGVASATGAAQIWFDEKLMKDNWAPAGMPRVIVYSSMTDEQ